ncbi:MAG: hypothetical protein L6Q68_02425 [Aquabacterium sp.]|nr:hypothetical protein [Aquabacterium sp.]
MSELELIKKDLRSLGSAQTAQLNRLLACEALLHSLIQLIDLPALRTLERHFDDSISQAMAQLPPGTQAAAVWSDLAATIADAIARRERSQRPSAG